MTRYESASVALIGGLLFWVRWETGVWLAQILTEHLPHFV